jgi:hypothetical protein
VKDLTIIDGDYGLLLYLQNGSNLIQKVNIRPMQSLQ